MSLKIMSKVTKVKKYFQNLKLKGGAEPPKSSYKFNKGAVVPWSPQDNNPDDKYCTTIMIKEFYGVDKKKTIAKMT